MTKLARTLGALGSLLLLVTAAFHGSGYLQVSEAIAPSEAPDFLKRAVPALWLHLNFEVTMGVADRETASAVREMLTSDLSHARQVTAAELRARPVLRLAARATRLSAPVQ